MTITLLILAAILAGLIVLGGVVEVACRLWFRHIAHVYIWPPYYHVEMDVDREILPNLTPHARFQANSLGTRGDEPPPRSVKAFHILACGGSGVECFALDQSENWPSLVGAFLDRPENREQLGVERVYVANLGKSGFTTDALCYTFPRLLPRFGPVDVVTIMLGTSAVNYWTKVGTPSELPPPDPPWADIEWHSEHPWGWRPKRTALAEVVRRLRYRTRRRVIVRTGAGKRFAKTRAMRQNAREMRDSFGAPGRWLEQYETSLARAVELARKYARRVVLIRQPWFDKPDPTPEEAAMFWHGSVGDAYVEFCDVFYTHRVLCALMELIDEATVRVGEKTGADVLRPGEVLEASAQHFYDHFHVTTQGARLMGDHLGRHLLELEVRERCGSAAAAT
jgi:hypothetical protein